MSYSLSQKSRDRLKGVDERLVRLVELAITKTPIDFTVLEGLRSVERQKELVNKGFSQTLKSKHLTGHAVDLGCLKDGVVSWDKELYVQLSKVVKECAQELKIPIRWGGDFKTFFDGPHYELV